DLVWVRCDVRSGSRVVVTRLVLAALTVGASVAVPGKVVAREVAELWIVRAFCARCHAAPATGFTRGREVIGLDPSVPSRQLLWPFSSAAGDVAVGARPSAGHAVGVFAPRARVEILPACGVV